MTLEEEILREVLERNKIPKETIEIVSSELSDAMSELYLLKDCPPIELKKEEKRFNGDEFKLFFVRSLTAILDRVHGPNYDLKTILTYRYNVGWLWEEMERIVERLG